MGELIGTILNGMQKHKMRLRGDVAVTMMTMAISESLIRQLDPEFDVVKNALPYFVRSACYRASSLFASLRLVFAPCAEESAGCCCGHENETLAGS
eukprot:3939063-Rhodomonas_salina.2